MIKTKEIAIQHKKTEKSTATIVATIPVATVKSHLNESLKHMGKDLSLKGFRKGKAPLNLIKENLDPLKVTNHTLEHLLPEVLKAIFKFKQYNLVGNPNLIKINTPTNEDWTLTVSLPLKPEFELGDYKKIVKSIKKTKTTKKEDKNETNENLSKILDALVKGIKLDVPQSIIDQEVDQSLSRLLNQTQSLGITIEDYLKSLKKTPEQLKQEYYKAAQENLMIEFILDKIAQDLNIKVAEKEIDSMINASGDDQAKLALKNPQQRRYIGTVLRKRKTIDALLEL